MKDRTGEKGTGTGQGRAGTGMGMAGKHGSCINVCVVVEQCSLLYVACLYVPLDRS